MEEGDLKKALLKRALGFTTDEVIEEYSLDEDGNAKLCKRKVTKKFNPPDISAVKMLMENADAFSYDKLSHMTINELKQERKRLLKLLKEEEESEDWKVSTQSKMWFWWLQKFGRLLCEHSWIF